MKTLYAPDSLSAIATQAADLARANPVLALAFLVACCAVFARQATRY